MKETLIIALLCALPLSAQTPTSSSPTPRELEEAFDGYFGYFGTYTVEENAGNIIFHVQGAAYPNYIGTDQRRFFALEGNRLTLRTPPERAAGADVVYVIV